MTLSHRRTLPAADFPASDSTVIETLRGRRIFVTGGTGFVGSWVLEYLYRKDRDRNLKCKVQVLSRNPEAFLSLNPHYATWSSLQMLAGDVRDVVPSTVSADLVLHGATPADRQLNESKPLEMVDIIVRGTENILNVTRRCGAMRLLFLSSGLIYGTQPTDLEVLAENQMGRLDALDPKGAYGNAKHFAEHLCFQHGLAFGFEVCIARLFAFVGPLLPLDTHFAVGNFLGDGLAGRTIRVQGDGTPLRSYLHAGELAHWLWTLLAFGRSGEAYNVGSDEVVSILELAERVARLCGVGVEVAGRPRPGQLPARYVPDIRKIARELGLRPRRSLDESLRRTLVWHRMTFEKGSS